MNFKTFLIKYTNLDIHFIDDFYMTITGAYIKRYDEYLIDSKVLQKWLKIEDNQLYENKIHHLDHCYYKVDHNKIMLSREGAELLCQIFNDNLIIKYLHHIEEAFIDFVNDPEADLSDYPDPDEL